MNILTNKAEMESNEEEQAKHAMDSLESLHDEWHIDCKYNNPDHKKEAKKEVVYHPMNMAFDEIKKHFKI